MNCICDQASSLNFLSLSTGVKLDSNGFITTRNAMSVSYMQKGLNRVWIESLNRYDPLDLIYLERKKRACRQIIDSKGRLVQPEIQEKGRNSSCSCFIRHGMMINPQLSVEFNGPKNLSRFPDASKHLVAGHIDFTKTLTTRFSMNELLWQWQYTKHPSLAFERIYCR